MKWNSSYIRPAVYLALGLAALVVVGLIGRDQLRKGAKYKRIRSGNGIAERWTGSYENEAEKSISQSLLKNIDGDRIIRNLRELTKKPHTAGTEANHRVAEWIRDQWKSQGLQDVHFAEYDVLLSHPADYDRPNTVELQDGLGALIYRSVGESPPLVPTEQSDRGANLTYNAYSASGTAVGDLVYVNYGRKEDFDLLEKENISAKGKIVIVRYGAEWRGAKASEAQRRGAVGVIIYSDPAEVCPNITDEGEKYPHSVWMPRGGVQLGSLLDTEGDPLTPLYPAVDYMYRTKTIQDLLKEGIIPSIPVQPMSYGDAYEFLSRMNGKVAPAGWQGGLNITYRFDQGAGVNSKVRLTVRANTTTNRIKNVIGFIEGQREPDRYIIVGNHFDAWIYGAIDPNSATAVMLEISRAFMSVINQTGWRPLRTIVFCAWDAEEYSLVGSSEWVEQYSTLLDRRAVAYLNVDLISGNETLFVAGTPTLYGTAVKAAKRVPNPDAREREAGRKTAYDTWLRKLPSKMIAGVPEIPAPGGGSDHTPFFKYLGVPVLDFRYKNITKDDSYPLYHTLYETLFVEDKIADPDNFIFHAAIGQFWAEMARILASSDLLPLNVQDYVTALKHHTKDLNETLNKVGLLPKMRALESDLESLNDAIDNMMTRAEKFHYHADELRRTTTNSDAANVAAFELFNSRLQQVERCFINPRGLPASPAQRHIVFGVGTENSYASSVLPFVYDQISKYEKAQSDQDKMKAYNGLREQISILHYSVDCVTSLLKKMPVKAR